MTSDHDHDDPRFVAVVRPRQPDVLHRWVLDSALLLPGPHLTARAPNGSSVAPCGRAPVLTLVCDRDSRRLLAMTVTASWPNAEDLVRVVRAAANASLAPGERLQGIELLVNRRVHRSTAAGRLLCTGVRVRATPIHSPVGKGVVERAFHTLLKRATAAPAWGTPLISGADPMPETHRA